MIPRNGKNILCSFELEELILLKMAILSKAMCGFNVPIKLPMTFFTELEQITSKNVYGTIKDTELLKQS